MKAPGSGDEDHAIGVLIGESLRAGRTLTDLDINLGGITRLTQAKPALGQPRAWTLIEFTADASGADSLAECLAEALDSGPWYVEFHTHHQTFVVFRDRVFRFPRDDDDGHTAARTYGRNLGIPDHQLDWTR
ncbi:hypothetical protein [Nocardia africana]|uniref:Uncharacterized protein n=1 Tax=Nocardia africana TaxID=134964 RepID=A0ABW6NTX7_9NOCA